MELGTELGNTVSVFVGVHSRAEGTECWEAQSQLKAGKASGAYPGGGGGT